MNTDTRVKQANALREKGQTDEARTILMSILENDPTYVPALQAMVEVAQTHDEAVTYLEQLVAVQPDNTWAQAELNKAQQPIPNGSGPSSIKRLEPADEASSGSDFAMRIKAWWGQVKADWLIFRRNRLAMVGLFLLVLFTLMAVSHPLLMEFVWVRGIYHPEVGYDVNAAPWPSPPDFPTHILGVDGAGRDVFSQLLASTRPSFTVAIAAAFATAIISTAIGAVGAYFRGPLDAFLANISDALLLIPVPIVMVLIGGQYYDEISALEFGLLYGLLAGASGAAIVMRSHAITIMNSPYIEAARVAGSGPLHIITRHLIPHMLPLVAVHMMVTVTGGVVAHGFVTFLGLSSGQRLNWGSMIYNAINSIGFRPDIQWISIMVPTLCLSLFAAAFYFVGRGLQDISDPRLRGNR